MSRFFSRVDYKSQKDNAGLKLGIDKTRYNIAIAGHTKIGKSTLVNTLIGKKLAKTGPAETTNHVAKYDSIIIPGVTVWDFAGCGTRKHNVETYYIEESLYAFEILIIVTQETITPEEMKLAAESLARKQPVLFVRSRCDIDLDNNKKIDNTVVITQKTADDFVEKMLVSFEKEINESKLENVNLVKTFFISSIFLAERLNGEVPTYSFQEKEFLTEIKTAIATLRGKF